MVVAVVVLVVGLEARVRMDPLELAAAKLEVIQEDSTAQVTTQRRSTSGPAAEVET
jgi:hypothetical protein